MIQKCYEHAIWQLVSMTREDFERSYLATLNNFETFMQEEFRVNTGIERAIRALKIRRAYMLPVGADTETCYRQNTIWTYAVFLSALTLECWKKADKNSLDNYPLMLTLVPSPAQIWLERFPNVLQTLQFNPINIKANENILAEIIYKAEEIHAKKLEQTKQTVVPEAQTNLFDALLNWINEGIRTKNIVINGQRSFIHRVPEGIFLIMPDCYISFAKNNPKLLEHYLKTQQNSTHFTQQLTVSGYFNLSDDDYLHRYSWDDWNDRIFSDGLVIRDISMIPEGQKTELNTRLTLDLNLN